MEKADDWYQHAIPYGCKDAAATSRPGCAVTPTYKGDVRKTIKILQSVLATAIVCVLHYTHSFHRSDWDFERSRQRRICRECKRGAGAHDGGRERINQLGGKPELYPARAKARISWRFASREAGVAVS